MESMPYLIECQEENPPDIGSSTGNRVSWSSMRFAAKIIIEGDLVAGKGIVYPHRLFRPRRYPLHPPEGKIDDTLIRTALPGPGSHNHVIIIFCRTVLVTIDHKNYND